MGWFNYYGLIVTAVMISPNIIFAVKHKNEGAETSQNKVLTVVEQIGRYGCLLFMTFQIPYTVFDFWFPNALIVYLSVNGTLCFLYLLFWVVCRKQNGMLKAVLLSVIPSVIFLFSGIVLGNLLLILCAVLFAGSHIPISIKNAKVANRRQESEFEKGLRFTDDYRLIEVVNSEDKQHRFVILKSENGYFTYQFQTLETLNKEELKYSDRQENWVPHGFGKVLYDNLEDLKREMQTEPEYQTFFKDLFVKAHTFSSKNEKSIAKSKRCGCFCCLNTFDSEQVTDWVKDEPKTALCPYCHVDAVIGDADTEITEEFLCAMHKKWF